MKLRPAVPAVAVAAALLIPASASAATLASNTADPSGDATPPGQYDLATADIVYDDVVGTIQTTVMLETMPSDGAGPLFLRAELGQIVEDGSSTTCRGRGVAVSGPVRPDAVDPTSVQLPSSPDLLPADAGTSSVSRSIVRLYGRHPGLRHQSTSCAIVSTSQSGEIGAPVADRAVISFSGWWPNGARPKFAATPAKRTPKGRVAFRVRGGDRTQRPAFAVHTTGRTPQLLGRGLATVKGGGKAQSVAVRLNARGRALLASSSAPRTVRVTMLRPGSPAVARTLRLAR